MSFFNEYEIKARYIPAVLSSIPFIILSSFVKKEVWLTMFSNASWFLVVENISFSLIVIYFVMNIQRYIGKYWFEKRIFKDEYEFPTTQLLLLSNDILSNELKKRVRDEIEIKLRIKLFGEVEEKNNISNAKKVIKDAVALIRTHVGKGKLSFHYNIQYGFMRNIIAGCFWAILSSIPNILLFLKNQNFIGVIISFIVMTAFIALLIFNKKILTALANSYAKNLFIEFVTID